MKKNFYVIMIILASLLISVTAGGAGILKESWLAYERKGTIFGYEHVKMNADGADKLKYDIERGYKIDVVGVSQQDIKEKGVFITDKNFVPVSFELKDKFKVKTSMITGSVADGKLKVKYDDLSGGVNEISFPLKDLYFEVNIPDLIARRASEKNFSFNIFDLHNIRFVAVKVLKDNKGTVEAEVTMRGNMPEIMEITADGRVISSRRAIETLNRVDNKSYQTDEKVVGKLKAVANDDSDLTIKIDKNTGNVNKVIKAKVAVRWMNIPAEDFALIDNRQTVVSQKCEAGRYEVTLELKKTFLDTAPVAIAPPAVGLEKYIGESEYIITSDKDVIKLAKKLDAGSSDAVKSVRNILKWIKDNIKTNFIAETLSAPEILKKKCGKCSENAILFASLARALKIPVKISLGVSNTGAMWMGHMWNEVYIGGKWIAVDPSTGDFVSGITHIKFIDSDTIDGTQNVRTKLIDNLDISIIDFENEPARSDIKSGISGNTYTSAEYNCRISVPNKKWKLKEDKIGNIITVSAKPGENEAVDFAIVMFSVPQGLSPKTILDGRISALSGKMKDFKKISDGETKIAGIPAVRIRFSQTAGKIRTMTIINENTILLQNTEGYLFACIAPETEYNKYEADFKKMIASFELIK